MFDAFGPERHESCWLLFEKPTWQGTLVPALFRLASTIPKPSDFESVRPSLSSERCRFPLRPCLVMTSLSRTALTAYGWMRSRPCSQLSSNG